MKLYQTLLAFLFLAVPAFSQADPCAPKETPVIYPAAPDCPTSWYRSVLDIALCEDDFDNAIDTARTLACNAYTAADAAYDVAKNLADANYATYVENVNRYIQIRETYGQSMLASGAWDLDDYDAYMAPFYLVWETIHAQAQNAWNIEMAAPTAARIAAKAAADLALTNATTAATQAYLDCMAAACYYSEYMYVPDDLTEVGGMMLPGAGLAFGARVPDEVPLSILPAHVAILL